MKKNFLVMGINLIMICATAAVVFAADVNVSFNSNSVTVKSMVQNTKVPKVEVCVTLVDERGQQSQTTWTFYDVPFGGKTQNAPTGTKVLGAYSTYCAVPAPVSQ